MAEPLQQAVGGIDAVAPRAPAARPHPQLLRVGVSFALLALLLFLVDLETVWGVIAQARPELLALMFACMIAERLFAAFRWLVLLRTVEPGIAYWPVLRVTLISNFVGTFLPGGVGIEVLRVHGLARATADLPLALSSVLVERLCGLMALVLLTVLGLTLAPIHLPDVIQIAVVVGAHALGIEATPWIFIAIVPITILIALLPISLGGLGTREASYVAGVQPEAALVLALAREAMQLATTLPGAILWAHTPASPKSRPIS